MELGPGSLDDEGMGEASESVSEELRSSDEEGSADEEADSLESAVVMENVVSAESVSASRSSFNLGVEADGGWRKGMMR